MSEEMIEKAWAAFVNCTDDRYFGNRTKREKELKVLRELVSQAEKTAIAAYNPNERLREALEAVGAMKAAAEAGLQSCQPMVFIGTSRRREHYRLCSALSGIIFRAENLLEALSPLPQGEDT